MVNDPLMDSERNLERKQSQVKKTENNFIPYDPNTDEERSSGESYNSGLTASTQEAPKVDPIKYDLEKPSDPLSEISSAESYQLNPVEIQEFREEELLKPPPIKEGENPFYINEAEGIINPREFEALEKRTEEFSEDADLLNRQITEFNTTYDEFAADIDKDVDNLNSEFQEVENFYNSFTPDERNDSFWSQYNQKFDALEKIEEDVDKKIDMFNSFYDANAPFLDDREASVKKRERYIERDWDAIGDEFTLPPEISSGDIFDRDLPEYTYYLEKPGDIFNRDVPKYFDEADIQFTDESLEVPEGSFGQLTPRDIQKVDETLEVPEGSFQRITPRDIQKVDETLESPTLIDKPLIQKPTLQNRILDFELGSIIGKGDAPASPTVGGVAYTGKIAGGIAWTLSGAEYLIDQAKNTKNLNVFDPSAIFDKDKEISDIDDYVVSLAGQFERGVNILPTPELKDVDGDGENDLVWKFVERDDPTSYGALRMSDEKRMNLPFGDIFFSSQENLDTLQRTEGMSANPFKYGGADPNFSEERFYALSGDRFRPIDLAFTLAQMKILGSILKNSVKFGAAGIKNAPQVLASGQSIVKNNIPDSMLTPEQIVAKAEYKSFKASDDITKQIDNVQDDITRVLAGERIGKWITKKPSPELIKKLEKLQTEIASKIPTNNISTFERKIRNKVQDGTASKKDIEVLDILEKREEGKRVVAEFVPVDDISKRNMLNYAEQVEDINELAQKKKNLVYIEKRFPGLAGTPQAEALANSLQRGGTISADIFDNTGNIGAAKLNPEFFLDKNKLSEIEAKIIKAEELIETKGRLPDGRYGQELLEDAVRQARNEGPQYTRLYKLDELIDPDGNFNFEKSVDWIKTTWKPGNKNRALVDDAYGKSKSNIEIDNPFLRMNYPNLSSQGKGSGSSIPEGDIKSGKAGLGDDISGGKEKGIVSEGKGEFGQLDEGKVPRGVKSADKPPLDATSGLASSLDKPDNLDAPKNPDAPGSSDKPDSLDTMSPDAPKSFDAPKSPDAPISKSDLESSKKRDEGESKKKDGEEGKRKSDDGKKKKRDDGEGRRKKKKDGPESLKSKRRKDGGRKKPKKKKRKTRIRLGDSASTSTPNIDVQSKIAAPKRFASKIQWKENNKYYQFDFNNKKITRSDDPEGSGVKKGNTPSETVKIIKRQSRKPRFQKAILGRIEISLQSPNSVALKNLPNYKTITKVSNFRK